MAGMVRVDGFAIFLGILVVSALFLALAAVARATSGPSGLEAPEYFALLLLSAAGMVVMTTANDLIVVFVALEALSIPLYVLVAFDRRRLAVAGGGHQVLRARLVRLGGVPLRRRARVRRHRVGVAHRDRASSSRRTRCSRTARCSAGFALLLVGLGVQGLGGAVPHVDARRVPGRAQPVTAFMSSATKVAGLRRLPAHLPGGVPAVPHRLASDHHGAGHRDARRRHRRRGRADRRQARRWRTRRSPTPATSSSGSPPPRSTTGPPRTGASKPRCSTSSPTRS